MTNRIKAGDYVRVRQGGNRLGETLYRVEEVFPHCRCTISEVGLENAAPQCFDTSLLEKVENP